MRKQVNDSKNLFLDMFNSITEMSLSGILAHFNWTKRYIRFEDLEIMLMMCLFHFRVGVMLRPSNFASSTTSRGFLLTSVGGNELLIFLKSIRSSLHFSGEVRSDLPQTIPEYQ